MNTHIKFLKNFEKFLGRSPIILLGPESFPLQKIKERYENSGYTIKTIYMDETDPEEVLREIGSRSMFSSLRRVFLLRNFLSNNRWKEILYKGTEGDIILLYDRFSDEEDEKKLRKKVSEWYRGNFDKSKGRIEIVLMPYLKLEERIRWVMGKASRLGISVDAEKAKRIVENSPPDLHHLNSEMEKLALGGIENMEKLLFTMKEESIFQITDALMKRDTMKILDVLEDREPIPAIAFIEKSLLNAIYSAEGIRERVKPSFMFNKFAQMGRIYYTKEMYSMLLKALKSERDYKSFHRGKLSLYRLAGEITK